MRNSNLVSQDSLDESDAHMEDGISKDKNKVLLPVEIWLRVFKFSDLKTLLRGPVLVCSSWRDIILSNTAFWKHMKFEDEITATKETKTLQQGLAAHQKYSDDDIKSIQICLGNNKTFDKYFLEQPFRSIESLELVAGDRFKHVIPLYSFIKSHPMIVELNFWCVPSPFHLEGLLLTLPSLKYLSIWGSWFTRENVKLPENNGRTSFSHPLKSLKVIVSDSMIRRPFRGISLDNLESLDVSRLQDFLDNYKPRVIDQTATDDISVSFPKLRHLTIANWDIVRGLAFNKRMDMPALEELELKHSDFDLSLYPGLSVSNLKRLTVSGFYYHKFDTLLVQAARNLQELNVDGESLCERRMLHSLSKLTKLNRIQLSGVNIVHGFINFIDELGEVLPDRVQHLKLITRQNTSLETATYSGAALARLVKNRLARAELSNGSVLKIESLDVDYLVNDDSESVEWLKKNVLKYSSKIVEL